MFRYLLLVILLRIVIDIVNMLFLCPFCLYIHHWKFYSGNTVKCMTIIYICIYHSYRTEIYTVILALKVLFFDFVVAFEKYQEEK